MGLLGIITLMTLGVMFVIVELFLMFGSVKVGTIGIIFQALGIWMLYQSYGSYYGNIALVTSVLSAAILLAISLRIMSKREVGLTDTLTDAKVNVIDTQKVKVGDVGIAHSDLKLGGRIQIKGEIYDAESIDEFIDDGTKIMITKVNSHQIFVKAIKDEQYMGSS